MRQVLATPWPFGPWLDIPLPALLPGCSQGKKERGSEIQFFWPCHTIYSPGGAEGCWCSSSDLEKITISSKYTRTNLFKKSLSTSFTSAWKTARTLVRPNSITRYWKCPSSVLNVVFYLSPFLMQTRWYVLQRSSFVNTVAPWRGSKAEFIRGKGYLFLIVMSFNLR